MKIILYSIPNDIHAQAFKIFLNKNNLPFKEIIVNNENTKTELIKLSRQEEISALKVTFSHSIHVYTGFDEQSLNLNILEHIKKYKAHVEKWENETN